MSPPSLAPTPTPQAPPPGAVSGTFTAPPIEIERWSMRIAIVLVSLVFGPLLWRGEGLMPLVSALIFLPFIGVYYASQFLKRLWPKRARLACYSSSLMFIGLTALSPQYYPRASIAGVAPPVREFVLTSFLLLSLAVLTCVVLFLLLRTGRALSLTRRAQRTPTGTSS